MESQIRYELQELQFATHGDDDECVAQFFGEVRTKGYRTKFKLNLAPRNDGEWQGRTLDWTRPPLPVLQSDDFVQQLVNASAKFLCTFNMWPTAQEGQNARMAVNEKVILPECDDCVIISIRHHMLGFPSAPWSKLWSRIENRLKFDPFFHVLGFEREAVANVLPHLKRVFSPAWVKARFREAGLAEMSGQIEPENEGFFPAYHLARAAHGMLCRDPGWNYLVEIGLAIETLQGVAGLNKLQKKLAASPGTQHHLCLAAELHERGLLVALDPSTGSGGATSDLLVTIEGQHYQIEVKEFSSHQPLRSLKRQLAEKVRKLPAVPEQPVIFHVVFRETGAQDVLIEQEFFKSMAEIETEIPAKISAVVAGRRFVDSLGGPVKRDVETLLVNENAIVPAGEEHLREIFKPNYREAHAPLYGLASLFVFGQRREEHNEKQAKNESA